MGVTKLDIDRINKPRRSGDLILYTRRWGPSTSTLANGAEVVLTGAALPLRVAGSWTATVAKVVKAGGDVTIPAGALVLSAQGAPAATIGALAVGSTVTVSTSVTAGWEDVVEAIGGREWLVEDGAVGSVRSRHSRPMSIHVPPSASARTGGCCSPPWTVGNLVTASG